MSRRDFFYGEIPGDELKPNQKEVAARLRTERFEPDAAVQDCEILLRNALNCRYAAVLERISFPEEDFVDLGFGPIRSHALFRNLSGCEEAFLFAVTLGPGVDRLLKKLSVTSTAQSFIADALASAYAEAACDRTDELLRGTLRCRPRFSPGYGDCPLSVQPNLLTAVNAERLLNIRLGKTLLMSPTKSITAIMGIIK